MDNYIRNPHPLILEGLTVRDRLVLNNGDETLIRKLDALLGHGQALHGGEQEKLRRLIAQANLK
jgi:hypothetical protein